MGRELKCEISVRLQFLLFHNVLLMAAKRGETKYLRTRLHKHQPTRTSEWASAIGRRRASWARH